MSSPPFVFKQIKDLVLSAAPAATVSLFGSRAKGTATTESDWDVLVVLPTAITRREKRKIQDAVFPLSVEVAAFINLVIVSETEWQQSPFYYSLRQTVLHE